MERLIALHNKYNFAYCKGGWEKFIKFLKFSDRSESSCVNQWGHGYTIAWSKSTLRLTWKQKREGREVDSYFPASFS